MPSHRSITSRRVRTALAGTLAVWLSGVLLLICCCGTVAASQVESEFCPLAKMQRGAHCDKMRQGADAPAAAGVQADCIADCGMLPAIFDRSRKLEPTQEQAAPVTAAVAAAVPLAPAVFVRVKVAVRPRIYSRQNIYLLNRNLRI